MSTYQPYQQAPPPLHNPYPPPGPGPQQQQPYQPQPQPHLHSDSYTHGALIPHQNLQPLAPIPSNHSTSHYPHPSHHSNNHSNSHSSPPYNPGYDRASNYHSHGHKHGHSRHDYDTQSEREGEYYERPAKKDKRPTLGDTIYLIWDSFWGLLSPRRK